MSSEYTLLYLEVSGTVWPEVILDCLIREDFGLELNMGSTDPWSADQ